MRLDINASCDENGLSLFLDSTPCFLIPMIIKCNKFMVMETQHKLVLVKNNTTIHVEIIDNKNMSLKPITNKTKALKVTIGLHTNKVVFNVISCFKNSIIIELSWLPLHNSQMV
jgi:hypothetical protein